MRDLAIVMPCALTTAYSMHTRGELAAMGIKVLRIGRCLRVSTASVRRALAVEPAAGEAAPKSAGRAG